MNFVHLGYRVNSGIATIWEEGEAGDKLVRDYLKDLEIVAKDGIKMVCMHVTKSNKQSPMSEIGLSRWRKIVKKAPIVPRPYYHLPKPQPGKYLT